MATLQELFNDGTLQLYQTITVAQESATADLTPVSVQTVPGTSISVANPAFLPDFIPATLNPRVTPVIIFG
jgi:hypothetical protein